MDSDRRYHDSLMNLKYLKIPTRINFNLNQGDDSYVPKPASADDEKLTHLLTFLMKHPHLATKPNGPEFVCFRGLLRMLMSTPYEEREDWIVLATKFKGCIYLCAEETERKRAEKLRRNDRDIKFMRYGFKFESYILSDAPDKQAPGNTKPVLESEEFCLMFSTFIDKKKILYGAETDGVIADEPCKNLDDLRRCPLVEVKVSRRETNERQLSNFYKFKSQKWFLQSFLVGIDKIHVGVRNDEGFVQEVKSITCKEITNEAKRNDYWHATVAMNFLNDFLNKVSSDMKHIDNLYHVHRYTWSQSRSNFVTCEEFKERKHGHFLTPDFIKFMENL